MSNSVKCKKCNGIGKNRQGDCAVCKGSGQVIVTKDKDGNITSIAPAVRT